MRKIIVFAEVMIAVASAASAEETEAVAPVAVKSEAGDAGFASAATMDFFSAYVWRGCRYNDRPVFQPGAPYWGEDLLWGGVSVNVSL